MAMILHSLVGILVNLDREQSLPKKPESCVLQPPEQLMNSLEESNSIF